MNTLPELRSSLERDLGFTCEEHTPGGWQKALVLRINELIVNDFQRLVAALYRLDVSEITLKQRLKEHKDSDAAEIIAELIIQRQVEKIKTRHEFGRKDSDLDENEKW